MPFLFSSLVSCRQSGVSRRPGGVQEVRRQFREILGILEGTGRPEYGRTVDIVTGAAIKNMMVPSLIPVAFPVNVGIISPEMLGGPRSGRSSPASFPRDRDDSGGGAWTTRRS